MKIKDVLQAKASGVVITIEPDATVRDLLRLLAEHNVGALIVSSDGTSVEGIVSERDVVRRLNEDEGVLGAPVSQIMTSEVATCEITDEVNKLMALMTERRIRHVPVMTKGELTGVISIGDIVKKRIDELEFERDQLDSLRAPGLGVLVAGLLVEPQAERVARRVEAHPHVVLRLVLRERRAALQRVRRGPGEIGDAHLQVQLHRRLGRARSARPAAGTARRTRRRC